MNTRTQTLAMVCLMAVLVCGCVRVYPRTVQSYPRPANVYIENRSTTALSEASARDYALNGRSTRNSADTREAAEELLQEIEWAYRKDDSDTVVQMAQEMQRYPKATQNQRAQALVFAGASRFVHGDTVSAQQYFQQSVRKDPDVFPNEKIRTTEMVEFFLRVRRELTER